MATTGSVWEGDSDDRSSSGRGRAPARAMEGPSTERGGGTRRGSDGGRHPECSTSGKAPSACPDCGVRTVADGWEVVCRDCGLVVAADRIQRGPEWRYESETPCGRRRCNGAPERASKNPGWARTRIGTRRERRRDSTRGVRFLRLERLHTRACDYETEVMNHAIPEVKRVCSGLDLRGDTVERACGIFRRARSSGFLGSRRIETVAGAAVYLACREHQVPRLPDDVASVVRVSDDDLPGSTAPVDAMLRAFRGMCETEDLHVEPRPLTPLDYLPRFASTLDVPPATRLRGRSIAAAAVDATVVVNRPPGCVAGGSLDLAIARSDRRETTHVEVAEATGYAVETLRDVRQQLADALSVDAIEPGRATSS